MSMMRNQGQLLFDLEYPAYNWVLPVHYCYFLGLRDTLHFLRRSLSKAGLNRPKLQSVKSLDVLFGETSELFGSCYLNASLILDKDCIFRETSEVLELLQGSCQSVEVWAQSYQFKQLSTGHVRLDLVFEYLGPLIVCLLHLAVLYTDPLNLLDKCGLRVHHGLLDVLDQGLELPVPLG
jgi:hypothetical protein